MITLYGVVKTLHILSGTILFGTGLGTAFYFWTAHRTGDARIIAAVGKHIILGDWLFTASAGVLQPLTGFTLIHLSGGDVLAPWLGVTYCLYVLAFACWVPVVRIQIESTKLAAASVAQDVPLPPRYFKLMRFWFWLSWPAFISLVIIVFLMVAQPA